MKNLFPAGFGAVLWISGALIPATETRAADWEWTIAPYIWGSGVSIDMDAEGDPVIGADASFSDILDKTDLAGMIHFEGGAGKAGFFVDALFLSLSGETTTGEPPLVDGTTVDTEFQLGIYEGGGFYRVGEGILDVIFGLRDFDLKLENDIVVPPPLSVTTSIDGSRNLLDGFVGLRYGHSMGKRWDFVIRGDVGAGDTDLTWNAVGTAGLRFGKTDRYSMRFGYRHMDISMGKETVRGVDIDTDVALSGPIVGFVIKI